MWTLELKFFKFSPQVVDAAGEHKWIRQQPVAEVVLLDVSEETKLASLLTTSFLIKKLCKEISDSNQQQAFNLWLTEPANKESGGLYDWSQMNIALKKMSRVVAAPVTVAAEKGEEREAREDGELEEGEFAASEDDEKKVQKGKTEKQMRVAMQTIEAQHFKEQALSLREALEGAYVQEFPTLYIALPLIN